LPDPAWTIGKHALMNLHVVRRNGRTEIDPRSWRIPYQWQGCHYQDHDDQPFLLLINSGGGFVEGDAFEFLARSLRRGDRFDAVVLDPPVYSRGKKGRSREFSLRRDLGPLVEDALSLLAPGGELFVSTNYAALEPHAFRRLLHHLQQGVGGFLVHPLHMVEQDGAALGGEAGIENFGAHGLDLTDEIPPARAHAGDGDGLPHDARFHPTAAAVAGLTYGTTAFAPQKGLSEAPLTEPSTSMFRSSSPLSSLSWR